MVARREYSEETKAAVMAALLTGQSISSIAKDYEIPKATISSWKSRIVAPLQEEVARDATQKEGGGDPRMRIGEELMGYVLDSLQTLRAQVKVFRDEVWLKKQGASELAVLHGVLTDKAIRLLEALANGNDSAGEEP